MYKFLLFRPFEVPSLELFEASLQKANEAPLAPAFYFWQASLTELTFPSSAPRIMPSSSLFAFLSPSPRISPILAV